MNRSILTASTVAVTLLSTAAPTVAVAAEVPVYDGTVRITKLNKPCIDDGWRKGQSFTMTFRSQVRPSNRRGGGIQLLTPRNGYSMVLPNGRPLPGGRRTGTFSATAFSSQVGTYFYDSPFSLVISPASITASTKSVSITGTLKGLAGVPSCVVTIKGSAKLRR